MTDLWILFHRAWGHAKESPEYDKTVWLALQKKLEGIERERKQET